MQLYKGLGSWFGLIPVQSQLRSIHAGSGAPSHWTTLPPRATDSTVRGNLCPVPFPCPTPTSLRSNDIVAHFVKQPLLQSQSQISPSSESLCSPPGRIKLLHYMCPYSSLYMPRYITCQLDYSCLELSLIPLSSEASKVNYVSLPSK